jgi:hypothetical protein
MLDMVFWEGAMSEEQSRPKLYPLHEVIVITILAVITMARGWEDIERYGRARESWLGKFLSLE